MFYLLAYSALNDNGITLREFIDSLQVTPESMEVLKFTKSMLGRDLAKDDFMTLVREISSPL